MYDRVAFIGGPPRVGKSSIAKRIIDIRHGTQIISTDSIRDALKNLAEIEKEICLFLMT